MTAEEHPTPKATLYVFNPSLWASVPRLGLIEKGYKPDEYNLKSVDLCKISSSIQENVEDNED